MCDGPSYRRDPAAVICSGASDAVLRLSLRASRTTVSPVIRSVDALSDRMCNQALRPYTAGTLGILSRTPISPLPTSWANVIVPGNGNGSGNNLALAPNRSQ